MGRSTQKLILPSILALGGLIRIINLDQSLWLDEAINVLATKEFSLWGMLTEYATADFHPPGYFVVLWIWTHFFGISEVVVRAPSVIFGLLTIFLIYQLGVSLHSRRLGLISAIFLAVNPLHIYYSQEARMYAFATFAVLLNILFFWKLLQGHRVKLVFFLSTLLVLSADYVAYMVFPFQLLMVLIGPRKYLKTWVFLMFLSLLCFIWWVPIFFMQLGIGTDAAKDVPGWKNVVGGIGVKELVLTFVKFAIGRISNSNDLLYAILVAPIGLLYVVLVSKAWVLLDPFRRRFLAFGIIVPLALAGSVSLIVPIYNYFRVLFVLPIFLTFLGVGAISLSRLQRKVVITVICLVSLISTTIYIVNPAFQRENWKGLVKYLEQESSSSVLFESTGSFRPFDYYAKIPGIATLKSFPALVEDDVVDLEEVLRGSKSVYLLNYLVEVSDPNRFVDIRLRELGYSITETKDFAGVGFLFKYSK